MTSEVVQEMIIHTHNSSGQLIKVVYDVWII